MPLAGPDFVKPDGNVKAMELFRGEPLLKYILESRPWATNVLGYTFILRDQPETHLFVENHLLEWYPDATIVFLPAFTRGAALSVLAGLSCIQDFKSPIVVDLADIYYHTSFNVAERLANTLSIGGLALTFQSNASHYSYLRRNDEGKVVETAEKRVISSDASAGTYIFRSTQIYLNAIAHAVANEDTQSYNELFYICPLLNGVIELGLDVVLEPVDHVIDIKNNRS